jgi:ketosteroid isomerase-like protein
MRTLSSSRGYKPYVSRRRSIIQPLLKECLAFLIALPLLLSVGSATAQQSDIRVVIEEGNQQWSAAFSQGDSAAIAAMYTLNAQLFPMHSEIVSGMEAIQQFWQGVIASGVKGATLTTLEVDEQGDTAYEVGKYELRGEGNKVLDHGKYVVVWKREQGKWRLHRDIWNSNLPAPK